MQPVECPICFNRYEERTRNPKNTGCGHVVCLECLQDEALVRTPLKCPLCKTAISKKPLELQTNFSILSAASSVVNSKYFCLDCKKDAEWPCEKGGHALRSMRAHRSIETESSRKATTGYENVLEKVIPKLLHMEDIVKRQLSEAFRAQDETHKLNERLNAYANGAAAGKLEDCVREASKWALQLPIQERAVQLMGLERGACVVELKVGPGSNAGVEGSFPVTLNLESIGEAHPEILSVAQFLFYLLCQAKYLPIKQEAEAARGNGLLGPGDAKSQPRAPPPATVSEDGCLDLGPSGIGEAPRGQMAAEKAALLRSATKVTKLEGLKCNEDPTFTTKMIQKHAPYLECVFLRQVQQEHINLLGSLRSLKDLKLVGYNGHITARLPLQPGCMLRSLYLHLPPRVQLELWEAYTSSVVNVVVRIETKAAGVPAMLQRPAAASPNLRSLHLHRKCVDEHSPAECAKQLDAVRAVVSPVITVTCNMCRRE